MIRVKNCSYSPNKPFRFDVDIGDSVLVKQNNGVFLEGLIHSVLTSESVTVTLIQGNPITVATSEITLLIKD